jgi:tyrosinase
MSAKRARKNVENLSPQEIQDLRNGFQQLMDSGKYADFVAIHTASSQHGDELFLPWHRAFIFEFENALRRVVPDATLPYWDWIATPVIPGIFVQPADRNANPLFYADRYSDAQRAGLHYPTTKDVDGAMSDTDFFNFGGGYPPGAEQMGDLETVHGYIHNWVGVTMEDLPTSPNDPVFWIHHSQVDRLWAAWEVKNPGANPHDPSAALPGLAYTVTDVLDIKGPKLGYEYVEDTMVLATGSPSHKLPDGFKSEARQVVPRHFSKAQLRFEGLRAAGPVPGYLDAFFNGTTNHAGTLPLFAIHPHPQMKAMQHRHKITMTLDVTDQVRRLSRDVPLSVIVKMSHPAKPRPDFQIGFDRIVLAFPS